MPKNIILFFIIVSIKMFWLIAAVAVVPNVDSQVVQTWDIQQVVEEQVQQDLSGEVQDEIQKELEQQMLDEILVHKWYSYGNKMQDYVNYAYHLWWIEFVKLINKGGFEYNNNYERFIESTYQRVIVENTGRNEVSFVNYGPANIPFMATTNSLVIGVRWDEYNLNGKSDKEWDINHDKQIEFIDSLKNGFDRKCAKELDIPGALIKYDEYSVYMKYPAEEIKY